VAGIPLVMAIFTQDVKFLVELTGSYAGLFIMFVIPAALAYFSRKQIKTVLGSVENTYRSPFANTFWIYLIFFLVFRLFVHYNLQPSISKIIKIMYNIYIKNKFLVEV